MYYQICSYMKSCLTQTSSLISNRQRFIPCRFPSLYNYTKSLTYMHIFLKNDIYILIPVKTKSLHKKAQSHLCSYAGNRILPIFTFITLSHIGAGTNFCSLCICCGGYRMQISRTMNFYSRIPAALDIVKLSMS